MFFQARDRLLDHFALLAEGEADEISRLAILVEYAERNERDARFAHQALAEDAIRLVRQRADVGSEEERAFASQRLEAEPFNPLTQKIAFVLQLASQTEREIHFTLQPIGNTKLQRRRSREGDEL